MSQRDTGPHPRHSLSNGDSFNLLSGSIQSLTSWASDFYSLANFFTSIFGGSSDCPEKLQATQLVAARMQAQARLLQRELAATQQGLAYARQELASCISGSNYRQQEVTACNNELAYKQTELNAAARELATRQQLVDRLQAQVSQLASQLQAAQTGLEDLAKWRASFPGLGPLNAARQFAQLRAQVEDFPQVLRQLRAQDDSRCHDTVKTIEQKYNDTIRTLQNTIQQLRNEVVTDTREVQTILDERNLLISQVQQLQSVIAQLRSQLTQCKTALTKCEQQEGQITVCQRDLRQCQHINVQLRQSITVLQQQHNQDIQQIGDITQRYSQCHSQYQKVIGQLTICQQKAKQDCPPMTCERLKTLHGTCAE